MTFKFGFGFGAALDTAVKVDEESCVVGCVCHKIKKPETRLRLQL
jgi:hypothetical protein